MTKEIYISCKWMYSTYYRTTSNVQQNLYVSFMIVISYVTQLTEKVRNGNLLFHISCIYEKQKPFFM